MGAKKINLKKHILCFFVSMAVFALLNIPSESNLFRLGSAELRISAILPVTAGLIAGPAGAFGCAAGNLLSDCFGELSVLSVFGCIANFLYAWLPYRMWHTLMPVENHKLKFISSANTMLKFIVITMFSTVVSMAVLASGCELLNRYRFFEIYTPTLLCNLFFSLFGGTVLFLILTKVFKIKPFVPEKVYRHRYIHKRYIPDYILCAGTLLLIALKAIYNYISFYQHTAYKPHDLLCSISRFYSDQSAYSLDIAIIALVILLAALPFIRSRQADSGAFISPSSKMELQTQIILVFFAFTAVCSFMLFCILEYIFVANKISPATNDDLYHITLSVLFYINLIGIIFIALLYLVLKMTEKRVTKPISCICDYCGTFVQNGLATKLPDFKKASTEISHLASSYEKMTSDIVRYIADVKVQAKREANARAMLNAAAKIQTDILPDKLESEAFSAASYIKPAQTVGGDFYDFIRLDDNRLLMCVADVSSKGLPAAIFMAVASTLIKCSKELSPEQILTNANNTLCENNSENMFVTMFIGIIDADSGTLEFANAGHNFPVILNGSDAEWLKSKPNPALGLFPGVEYRLHKIKLERDFELLLYTDGVNEAENEYGEFFGNERLMELCRCTDADAPVKSQLDKIIDSVHRFTGNAPQSDDMTALMVRFRQKTE